MERDLCTCGRWREEHYGNGGAFVGHLRFGCFEYQGIPATAEQRANKAEEIEERREDDNKRLQESLLRAAR